MSRRAWMVAVIVVIVGLVWTAASLGVFSTPADLERAAESLDAGVLDKPPFEPGLPDGGVSDAGLEQPDAGEHSLAISGHAKASLHDFSMNDKQGRNVLKAKIVKGSMNLSTLKKGIYEMRTAVAKGVEITLYRDASGQVSIVHALQASPSAVQRGLHMPPAKKDGEDPWLLDIGAVTVEDATLTLGFTDKPVVFHIDSAKVIVRRGGGDPGPVIYLEEVQGVMTKPKPLPKPVRIAWANGIVQLAEEPLVRLAARACVGGDEVRVRAIVPKRKEAVDLTVDTQGLVGALARMGLKIAARKKSDKMHYQHGPVKIDGGPDCKDAEFAPDETEPVADGKEASPKRPAAAAAEHPSEPPERTETKHEERKEEREERREERHEKH
ncbi:MAG: hypothetical protein WBG86_01610 [Polyangiales bacterium]